MEKDELDFDPEVEEDSPADAPKDGERRLVTQAFDFIVRSLVEQIDSEAIAIDDTWQRKYVWDDKKASRLIESLLLNVPIPVCYFAEEDTGQYLVIDGQQRLWSIHRFVKNEFALKGLNVMGHLNGKRFFELDSKERLSMSSRPIRCIALTQESHPELRFDVFERLNSGAVALNPQELRHSMYRGPFDQRLKELSENPNWLKCLRRSAPDNRLREEELILRFFAFHYGLSSYRPALSNFLNNFMRRNKNAPREKLDEYSNVFLTAVDKAKFLFEDHCFRRLIKDSNGDLGWDTSINKALFDLQMLLCSRIEVEQCQKYADSIRTEFQDLMVNSDFIDLIVRATDHKTRVFGRFQMLCEGLASAGVLVPALCDLVYPTEGI